MYRIKSVANILKCFGMIPLLAAVQPNRNQCQQCKPLLHHFYFISCNCYCVKIAAKNLNIEHRQTHNLPEQAPPVPLMEKIKRQHHQDSCAKVIYHRNRSEDIIAKQDYKDAPPCHPWLFECFCLLTCQNGKQTDQKSPQHVLMKRIKNRASINQIEVVNS